ncbi:MAG TPA: translocation/assembly module TamB domain-containing protein [Steroidobacteraceae bacterium]|nr:translocation/assembly module TamB domain-containing protein [Steroidobacteraceae bacterium]
MRRGLKISAWVVGSVGVLIVALLGAVWVAGNTDSGRKLIERLTYRLTAGQVRLSGLSGSFPMQLTLDELQLSDGRGAWLTADHLALRWSPLKLLERRIRVDELQVARLHMERAPGGGQQHGGTVSIPHIDVGRFSIDTLELGAPLTGIPVMLSVGGNVQLRSLEDANAELAARRLDGEGEYTLHLRLDPKRMDASLVVHEPASGPLENLLSLPGLGALSATMTLQGPRDAARVDLALRAGDLKARAHGSVDLTRASADLEYSVEAPAMSPRPDLAWTKLALQGNWHGSVSALSADGRLDVSGLNIAGTQTAGLNAELNATAGKFSVRAVVTGLEIPGPQPRLLANDPVKLDATVQLNEKSRPIELTAMHPLFNLHAHAGTEWGKAGGQQAVVELRLPELAPFAAFASQDVQGNALINAKLAHGDSESTLILDANVALTGGAAVWIRTLEPRVALQLSGSLSHEMIKLQNLRVSGKAVTLVASGSATRSASSGNGKSGAGGSGAAFVKDLQARWQLEISDLAALSSDVAGSLKASGRLSGTPRSLASDAELTSRLSVRGSASGTVEASVHARGLPAEPSVTIQAHGMVDDAPLKVDAAVERSGESFQLHVRQADWKSAHIEGDLAADAALTRSHGQLRLAIAQLSDLDRLLGMSIAGSVDGNAGLAPGQGGYTQVHLELDGKNVVISQFAGNVHLQAIGASNALGLKLTAQLPEFYGKPVSLASAATLNVNSRELRLASLSVGYHGETFRLMSPALFSLAKGVSVDQFKIGAKEAIFELKGQLAPALDLQASLRHLNPDLMNEFMPGLLSSGTVEATVRLQGSPSSPTGSVRLDASNLRSADDAAAGLPPVDMHARAELAGDTATVNASLTGGAGSEITATGTAALNASGTLDLKVGGKLDVGLANPLLEARGMHATGQLSVNATVTGNPTAPQVGGGITLAQGSLRDYGRGINLSEINAEVVGHEGGLQIKSFKATAASGNVAMSGTFGILQPGMPVDLKVTAKNAQPIASSIVTANLDADVQIKGKARERIDVTGTIHVNRATIGIPNSLPPDVAVLDVRRRGQVAPAATEKRLVIGIDVAIRAPQEILVQGRGLDAELGGEIRLSGTSDAPLASGGFDLQRGSFTLVGNKLSFTQGRVSFEGAGLRKKIDPTLDFTAQTTLADTTATLRITGLADAPRFDFSSTPQLPQDEIMARLLFGENAAQLTALQAAQISYALATLSGVGSGGSNPLVKLQKTLGLDRLSVASNTTTTATGTTQNSGAAIAAGRYVTKRVYVEGKQTTTGTSQVQVDVDLTKHLKLQTRLGNGTAITQGTTPENDPGSSIGLSYQFEY